MQMMDEARRRRQKADAELAVVEVGRKRTEKVSKVVEEVLFGRLNLLAYRRKAGS